MADSLMADDGSYRHVDVTTAQVDKHSKSVCGDIVVQDRTTEAVTVAIFDGIGSGARANVAANLNAARLLQLLKSGFTLREAGERLAASMHAAREGDIPFAAFCVARVLNSGYTTVLTYEMPPSIVMQQNRAIPASPRFFTMGGEVVGEAHCRLEPGTGIVLMSDGVTQAGMGVSSPSGWGVKDVAGFMTEQLQSGSAYESIPQALVDRAEVLSGGIKADDTTAVLLTARLGETVNIMTGPARNKSMDAEMVAAFMEAPGIKVVCGSTTADIVARKNGTLLRSGRMSGSHICPPRYYIDGIDIVTEGAYSLNQLYNILDYDSKMYDEDSCVSDLAILIKTVDRVVFWLGGADNSGHDGIVFPQLRLFPRKKIIPFIEEKLRDMGKLVIRKEY